MARPSKYDPKMLKIITGNMTQGSSIEELPLYIGISVATIYDWINLQSPRYIPEFSETIKKGIEDSKAWWMSQGRKNIKNREFNSTLWYMNMKNRFGWKDNQAHDVSTTGTQKIIIEHIALKNTSN